MRTFLCRLSILLAVLNSSAALAATITVNSNADPAGFNPNITIAQLGATVTLRDAVNAANNTAGDDEIVFAPALSGQTILLTQVGASTPITGPDDAMLSALSATSTMTIRGPAGGVTIARDQSVSRLRLFLIASNGNLTVDGLTLADGLEANGATIQNNGTLALRSSTISNSAAASFNGGGIRNYGTLNLSASTLVRNAANYTNSSDPGYGGGLESLGSATITNCTFTQNVAFNGTAIHAKSGSTITLNHCTVVAQQNATDGGAAVWVEGSSTITNSIMCRNYWRSTSNGSTNAGNVQGSFSGSNNLINNESPGVGDLGVHGGPTQTMPLLFNSPAVDAAIPTAGVTADQRGVARPQGPAGDIGAFEFGVEPPAFASANAVSFFVGTTNNFQVTAAGLPAPTFSTNSTLPSGVTFTPSGMLSGSPAAGTEGAYPLTLKATNSFGEATQQFVLTVVKTDLIVTTAVDEDDGSIDPALGAGTSLHEAVNRAKTMGGSPTIVFSPALAGQTILCTIDQRYGDGPSAFRVLTNMTIQGLTGGPGITLARGVSGDMRAFEVFGGSLALNDLTLANWRSPYGAAILHGASVRLNRCTVRDNYSPDGIIRASSFGDATLVNCTVANNTGDYAMKCNGFYSLTNTTVTGNTGGGLYVSNNGATLINTIIAGNTRNGNPWDFGQGFARTGSINNLIGTGGSGFLVNGVNGNIVGVPANQLFLGPLTNNGGPTQTMALLGGPAVDGGATVSGLTSDQRGIGRPQHYLPDIGAFEAALTSLVVNTADDEDNGTSNPAVGNGTSLREALVYAQSLGGAQTITFAPELAGLTVTLSNRWNDADPYNSSSALRIEGNITVEGPASAPGIILKVDDAAQLRHFIISGGGTLVLKNLTLSGGKALLSDFAFGGAVWNFGALTVRNCTFTGNTAGAEGGAIQSWGDSPLLAIDNSTFAGNSSSGIAGAIESGAVSMTLRHVTITANNATNGNALVLYKNQATMINTIIAANADDGVGAANGGAFNTSTSTNNILGGGGTAGLTNGVKGNLTGVSATQLYLGSLGDNGGPTATIALQPGSLAIDAGVAISGLTNDQRGVVRPNGSGADIGAFELVQTQAAIPIVSPLGGTYENSVQITINSISPATAVRYTLDGSTPTSTNGQLYGAPFTLAQNTMVKAIAYGRGWIDSPVAVVDYTVLPPLAIWRNLQGLADDGSQDLANPSGDGIANLLKFAFNLAPIAGDLTKANYQILAADGTAGLPCVTRDAQGRLTIEFVRRKASTNPGIVYIGETGSDLATLQPLDLSAAIVASIDETWERVTVTDPGLTPNRFGRVRVSVP